MAPNVTAHFFAANDINGDVLHEITDEDSFFRDLTLSLERDGLGSADLLLSRMINFAGFASGTFQPEVFVRFLVSAYSDTVYYPWAFSMEKRQQVVIHKDEKGAEVFRFGGPGPKALLQRHALGINDNLGTGAWNIDLDNGVWRWTENASVGQILNRILNEDQARPDPSLPFMSTSFSASHDSNGVAWADSDVAGDGLFEIPIGTDYLTILHDMDDLVEVTSWIDLGEVGAPAYVLNVAQGTGNDYMGSAFASDVCLFKEGSNIANDSLTVEGQNLRKASHVIVEGKDGQWVVAERPSFSPGDYVKYVKIEHTRTSSDFWLEKAGIRWLQRQDLGEREYTIEIVPGTSDATGLYFPAPDRVLWLSNLVSLDSSADGSSHSELDVDPADQQLVTGIELALGVAGDDSTADAKAKSWDIKVKLNAERPGVAQKAPSQTSASNGGTCKCKQIQLCPIHIEGTPPSEVVTPLYNFNAQGDGGDSLAWTGNLSNQGPPGAGGSTHYYFKSGSPTEWSAAYAVGAGVDLRISGYVKDIGAGEAFKVGFFDSDQIIGNTGVNTDRISTTVLHDSPTGGTWTFFSVDVTTPALTASLCLGHDGLISFDQIAIESVDFDPGTGGQEGSCPEDVGTECATGTDACAARGDHVHAHGFLSADEAHYHDVAQIEGGTTAADTHVADTSDAHDASAISVLDTGGNFTATDVEAALAEIQDRIDALPSGTGIGEILISDTPSTPLVFADLIQNEAQTDLVYADP